ncbi:cbb3-type cytochrome oxidase subunit 3 [Alloalcanivorax sp. C16-1]|uniref:cbb3-type cytochrome oxidase subunit 3 n=1 Tax=Alloalcanivorax sp. C16-1 TaxID=3390051 RepID=UPI0039705B8F
MNYHALLTVIFFIAFLALVGWVYRPSRKGDYQRLGEIPLNTDPLGPASRDGQDHRRGDH